MIHIQLGFIQVKQKYNLTFPIASKPLSKSNNTPRNRKEIPNPANPTPISETHPL